MAENLKELISAMMDGEMTYGEVIQSTLVSKSDPNLLDLWRRYHLIRDALNKNLPPLLIPDLPARIKALVKDKEVSSNQ